jgi:hypothetical protein
MSRLLLALLATTALAACSDVERTFGLTRDIPDEFTVETRAPLSMPPDYTLRAPQPGAARPQEVSSQAAAEAALAPDAALAGATGGPAGGPVTPGQQALVAQAGPAAPADIRARVDSEVGLDRPGSALTDKLLFWQPARPAGTVLDATAESARLRENAALGQPATAGATPIIQDKPKSSFLGIF